MTESRRALGNTIPGRCKARPGLLSTRKRGGLTDEIVRRRNKLFAECNDLFEVGSGFLVGQVGPQSIIDYRQLDRVDLIDDGAGILSKGAKDVAGTGIISGNHAIFPGDLVVDLFELVIRQHVEVSTAEFNVVVRVE